jgi:hypothetical protein
MRLCSGLIVSLSLAALVCSSRALGQSDWYRTHGTATGQWGAPGAGAATGSRPFGAPGAVYPGTYHLRNQPGVGFFYPTPVMPGYPVYGLPQPVPGGLYGMTLGGQRYIFWKAPSGYYYPWAHRTYYGVIPPIVIINESTTTSAQPPLSTVFEDLNRFIEDSHEKNKLSQPDYEHLSRRLKDLKGKERSARINLDGQLDAGTEADIRKDLDALGEEVSRRVRD